MFFNTVLAKALRFPNNYSAIASVSSRKL